MPKKFPVLQGWSPVSSSLKIIMDIMPASRCCKPAEGLNFEALTKRCVTRPPCGLSPLQWVFGYQRCEDRRKPRPSSVTNSWPSVDRLYYKLLGGSWSYKAYDRDPCKDITWGRGLTKPEDRRS